MKDKKSKTRKYLQLGLKLVLTIAAMYFVIRNIDLNKTISYITRANFLYLFLAVFTFVLGQFISSLRLNMFFRKIDLFLSDQSNFKLYLLGMFYNMFLPGGIGGDAYKVYLLRRKYSTTTSSLIWSLITDRVIGLLVLFCLAVFLFLFIPGYAEIQWYTWILIPLAIISYNIAIRQFFSQFKGIFIETFSQSFFMQALQLFSALFILLAFDNQDNLIQYLLLFLISSVAASLPISVGGIGAREITFLYGAKLLSLDPNMAVALSFMFYLITLLTSLSGIYFIFNPKKMHLQ